ncbi:MAG: UDP-N-acetylmuramyl-tripeptide synthetase [Ruminococcaceae bacterium]|nr:UDP-N-acetylmuramyl-tripeptide synthetase [Oscillospiraceae bacterium]
MFVCVKGNVYDGNRYSKEAVSRGAVAVVTDEKNAFSNFENAIICKSPRKCEAEISKILYGENVDKLKIIGITGTKGKTTTAKILSECIAHLGLKCVSLGTLGVEYYEGKQRIFLSGKSENTTPDAPFIYKALSDAYRDGARVAVIEVSSQALMSYRVFGIPFTACVFTNFSEDHIGEFEHSSIDEYLRAKRTLFSSYGSKICVINSDDESSEFISHGMEHIIEVGRESEKFKVNVLLSDGSGNEFSVNGVELSLSLGGEFNAYNAALATVTASLLFGRDISEFREVLKRISVLGRYELYKIKDKTVIIDFAHNAESFRSVLTSVRKSSCGKIITLFGSVGERSIKRRSELARVAEAFSDFLVITSDNPGREAPEKICNDIYSSLTDKSKARIITDREAAIRYAVSRAEPSDTVLLLGKGHEKFQIIGNEKIPFSEGEIIKSLGAVRICNRYGV